MRHRFIFALGIIAACTACSAPEGQAAMSPASAATSSVVSAPAPAAAAEVPIADGPLYFHDLLQRRDFASAFAVLSGADQLPDWPRQGGTSNPAQRVVLNGRPQWLATACKPHDCPSERILVLYDENTHAMSGVFARRKPGAANDVDSNDEANDDLIWLGAPDEAAKQFLRAKLYSSK